MQRFGRTGEYLSDFSLWRVTSPMSRAPLQCASGSKITLRKMCRNPPFAENQKFPTENEVISDGVDNDNSTYCLCG